LKALTNKSFEGEKQSWCANNFSYAEKKWDELKRDEVIKGEN
jgi:hypothetical protein